MKVGVDGDVLRYELGAVAIEKTEVFGVVTERPWPAVDVCELVDQRIQSIIERTGSNEFEVFLTGAGNFRFDIATIAPYKGNRASVEKPYHWQTVSDRLISHWGARIVEGVEADDALAIKGLWHSLRGLEYVIASRDKDLRMVPCFHYSWACGENQPEIPIYKVEGLGEVICRTKEYIDKNGKKVKTHKMLGNGLRFFYGQLLTGDTVDNIKGCPKVGPVKAVELLQHLETEKDMYQAVASMYHLRYGDDWLGPLVENARLLWLIQDPTWVTIKDENNLLKFTVNKLWSPTYDYDRFDNDTGREDSNCNGSSTEAASAVC